MRQRSASLRVGVTLLELLVVLALMGLVLAIAAPAFISPRTTEDSGFTAVVATARRAAVLRAEPVTVAFDADGAWHIDGDATRAAAPIATGRLTPAIGELHVRVSPLGTCVPDRPVSAGGAEWDPLACRLGAGVREASRR